MSEILLCNQSLNPQYLQAQCGISIDQISALNCTKPKIVSANTPYLMGGNNSVAERSILSRFSPMPVAKELTDLSLSY